jgi:hypothetical protein
VQACSIILSFLVLVASSLELLAQRAEYEVEGAIYQTIVGKNGALEDLTNNFTVSVKGCCWLIQIYDEHQGKDRLLREIGSTNNTEIFELVSNITSATNKFTATAIITSNNVPVGLLNRDVSGHLWLMFASRCYWESLQSDMLTPVFNWRASVGANPRLKVKAEWKLLGDAGSLPREVAYLGSWDETNGFYKVTETSELAGGELVPKSFTFEERYAVAMEGMVLRKRVKAEVSDVREVCSRSELFPVPTGETKIVDFRLTTHKSGNHVPTYRNPTIGQWPSAADARKLVPITPVDQSEHGQTRSKQRVLVFVVLMITLLLPLIVGFLKRARKANW